MAASLNAGGCSRCGQESCQGYLEGDFVYVSSPHAGSLGKLSVTKRSRPGRRFLSSNRGAEVAARRQTSQELRAARDQLGDLKKSSRPEEIAALEARVAEMALFMAVAMTIGVKRYRADRSTREAGGRSGHTPASGPSRWPVSCRAPV
jgi:hypothetical protein